MPKRWNDLLLACVLLSLLGLASLMVWLVLHSYKDPVEEIRDRQEQYDRLHPKR